MAPAGVHKLVEKGIVTGNYKKVNPGKIVLTFTMGDKELYDWLGNNPMCLLFSPEPVFMLHHGPFAKQ